MAYLPAQILVIHVAHIQALGSEGIRLHLHICQCELVHQAGLANIGVATEQQGAGVGVNGGQTTHVLTDLLQVLQAVVMALHQRAHATLDKGQAQEWDVGVCLCLGLKLLGVEEGSFKGMLRMHAAGYRHM